MMGDAITLTVSDDDWYVWSGCNDGTRPLDDGTMQNGFGKVTAAAPIQINKAAWILDSVDSAFWRDGTTASMGCYFTLYYTGETTQSDVVCVHVGLMDKNLWWTTGIRVGGAASINTTTKTLLSDMKFHYTNSISYKYDVMPIGKYTAVVNFSDGSVTRYEFVLTSPGQKTNGTYEYICSQDFGSTVADNYVKALTRPSAVSATKSGSNIEVSYRITDARVENGVIWFYDANKMCMGYTTKGLAEISSPFAKDGTTLTATITSADITYVDGYTAADYSMITYVVIGCYTEPLSDTGDIGRHRARTACIKVN